MKDLIDTYGDPITYLPENKFNHLCNILTDALDNSITALKETAERLHVNGKSFYTQNGHYYEAMYISQWIMGDLGFIVDQFNSKEDMLNCRNPM